jgi:hypothetical protein
MTLPDNEQVIQDIAAAVLKLRFELKKHSMPGQVQIAVDRSEIAYWRHLKPNYLLNYGPREELTIAAAPIVLIQRPTLPLPEGDSGKITIQDGDEITFDPNTGAI